MERQIGLKAPTMEDRPGRVWLGMRGLGKMQWRSAEDPYFLSLLMECAVLWQPQERQGTRWELSASQQLRVLQGQLGLWGKHLRLRGTGGMVGRASLACGG
jgi:hypothetical protein